MSGTENANPGRTCCGYDRTGAGKPTAPSGAQTQATGLYPGQAWGEVEAQMAGDWRAVRGNSPLSWAEVRNDAHAAWQVAKLDRDGCLRDHAPVTMPG